MPSRAPLTDEAIIRQRAEETTQRAESALETIAYYALFILTLGVMLYVYLLTWN